MLTGCTGLIGQYLLHELLSAGRPLAVLVRSNKNESATERVNGILNQWERRHSCTLPRPRVIEANLHEPRLGVSAADQLWIAAHCDQVVHNAANVTFQGSGQDGEPWLTNVNGTKHIIELCKALDIRQFIYMSTAYVSGDRTGTIRENELDLGQSFQSTYEHSKFTAEKMLHSAGFEKLTVCRPGSVVGDSRTAFTSTYHGLYLYVQFTWLAQQRAAGSKKHLWQHPVRLAQDGSETHHLVPLEWAAQAASRIIQNKALHGQTYHLTPQNPITARELERALSSYFNYEGVRFVKPEDMGHEEPSETETLFYASLKGAEHRYLAGDAVIDCSNTLSALPDLPCPTLDQETLEKLFHYAVTERFGRLKKRRHQKGDKSNSEPIGLIPVINSVPNSLVVNSTLPPSIKLDLSRMALTF